MDKDRRIADLEAAIRAASDLLSGFLLDNVGPGETWEDAYPEVDEARTLLLEVVP
jgi:hypothetical protein